MLPELTLGDLLALEPRLQTINESRFYDTPFDPNETGAQELTWAVTIRATEPMLPVLRGGELVVVPGRVLADTGAAFGDLAKEVAARGAVSLLLDHDPEVASPLPLLKIDTLPIEFESEINRLITEQRGVMYRLGTEAGRAMSQIASSGGDIGTALATAAGLLAMRVVLLDPAGNLLAESEPGGDRPPTSFVNRLESRGLFGAWYGVRLTQGGSLWCSPVEPVRFAAIRMTMERLAAGFDAVLAHVAEVRPRGAARAMALQALLAGTEENARQAATAMGLQGSARYRVVLAEPGMSQPNLIRMLSSLALVHEAGHLGNHEAMVLETGTDTLRLSALRPAGLDGCLAISEMVTGAAALPGAARQATYVAKLQEEGNVSCRIAWFDQPSDVGVYRLLYPLWGTTDLDQFTSKTLGGLVTTDKRGTLTETLLAWLEAGGSQIEAADRLGIHRNTLAYRMKQIGNQTGVDLTDPVNRLTLHMALLASRLPAIS